MCKDCETIGHSPDCPKCGNGPVRWNQQIPPANAVGNGMEAPTKRRLPAAEAVQALEDLQSTSYLRGERGLAVAMKNMADGRILAG